MSASHEATLKKVFGRSKPSSELTLENNMVPQPWML